MQDRVGGVPQEILDLQDPAEVVVPALDEAIKTALAAAREAAGPLIDTHTARKPLVVPDDYPSIQDAIDAATSGDLVLVRPGTYHELLTLKHGVKLASDPADGGDTSVRVGGTRLMMPARALRTIIDGSKSEPSSHGIIDFVPGAGRTTIVDGFTIQNLPEQNHHLPGHAHALNVRGASPVILNCIIRNNGSTGIGNHVVYHDQNEPMPSRDFRWANIRYHASPVIYHNIIHHNLGLGVGCNHFASPLILGNEVFGNDDSELGSRPGPAIGGQHGAFATIIGNIVHDNPGGGILCRAGAPQGAYPIDLPTHPTIKSNVVYHNGDIAPAIAAHAGGSPESPVRIDGNFVYDARLTGIALSGGSAGILENNIVVGSRMPGIVVTGATALKLNGNKVKGVNQGPGFLFAGKAVIHEMIGNGSTDNAGPRFMLREGTIGAGKAGKEAGKVSG